MTRRCRLGRGWSRRTAQRPRMAGTTPPEPSPWRVHAQDRRAWSWHVCAWWERVGPAASADTGRLRSGPARLRTTSGHVRAARERRRPLAPGCAAAAPTRAVVARDRLVRRCRRWRLGLLAPDLVAGRARSAVGRRGRAMRDAGCDQRIRRPRDERRWAKPRRSWPLAPVPPQSRQYGRGGD
jgi:hypothetical protein